MLHLGQIEITYQEGRRRELSLSHSPFSIGRMEGSDLVLSDRTVSKHHAQLMYHAGSWQIVDLGSANGTYIAGRRLAAHEPEPLADGVSVRIGSNTIVLHLGPPKTASAQHGASSEEQLAFEEMALLLAAPVSVPTPPLPTFVAELPAPEPAPALVAAPVPPEPAPQVSATTAAISGDSPVAAPAQEQASAPVLRRVAATGKLPPMPEDAEPVPAVPALAGVEQIAPPADAPPAAAGKGWWQRWFRWFAEPAASNAQRSPRPLVPPLPTTVAVPPPPLPTTVAVPRPPAAPARQARPAVPPAPKLPPPPQAAAARSPARPATQAAAARPPLATAAPRPSARPATPATATPATATRTRQAAPATRPAEHEEDPWQQAPTGPGGGPRQPSRRPASSYEAAPISGDRLRRVPIIQRLIVIPLRQVRYYLIESSGLQWLQYRFASLFGYTPDLGSSWGGGQDERSDGGGRRERIYDVEQPEGRDPEAAAIATLTPPKVDFTPSLRQIGAPPLPLERQSPLLELELAANKLVVNPGQVVSTTVAITNLGPMADHYFLELVGVPERWVTIAPLNLLLEPGARDEVEILLTVPRAAASHASVHEFAVIGRCEQQPGRPAIGRGALTIGAYNAFQLELQTPQEGGWRRAHFHVALHNTSNRVQSFRLQGRDDDGLLGFRFSPPLPGLRPGATQIVRLNVRTHPWHWFGLVRSYPFTVSVVPLDASAPAQEVQGRAMQQPLLGCGPIVLLLVLLAILWPVAAGALASSRPTATATPIRVLVVETVIVPYPQPAQAAAAALTSVPTEAAFELAPTAAPPVPAPAPPPAPTAVPPTAAPNTDLVCIPGNDVRITGRGVPDSELLVYLNQRPIGGSNVDAGGNFAITIRIGSELPKIYPLVVRQRGTNIVLFQGTCLVPAAPRPTNRPLAPTVELPPPLPLPPAQPPAIAPVPRDSAPAP